MKGDTCDECGTPLTHATEHRFFNTKGRQIETTCRACCPRCSDAEPAK